MKSMIETVSIIIIIAVCLYLGSAFIAWDLNPENWSLGHRAATIIGGPVLILVVVVSAIFNSVSIAAMNVRDNAKPDSEVES